jgi:hypothetical protein
MVTLTGIVLGYTCVYVLADEAARLPSEDLVLLTC